DEHTQHWLGHDVILQWEMAAVTAYHAPRYGATRGGTPPLAARAAAGTRGVHAATSPALRSSRPCRVPFVLEPSTPTPPASRPTAALPPTASAASPRRTPTTTPYLSNAASPSSGSLRCQRHRDTVTLPTANPNR